MKNIFATIGILAVILGIIIWQFGFFNKQVNDISQRIERATAVSRAESIIAKAKSQANSLKVRSRNMKIAARTMERSVEREQKTLARTKFAVEQLAQAIKTAGLPKPSEIGALTEEQQQKKIVFGGKEGSAMEAYNQLFKWQEEYEQKNSLLDKKRELIAKRYEVAQQMLVKQKKLYSEIEKIEVQLLKLETEREIAEINVQMAKLSSLVEDVNMSEIDKNFETVQEEIDELNATAEVIREEADTPINGDVFSMPEIPSDSGGSNSLDALWD